MHTNFIPPRLRRTSSVFILFVLIGLSACFDSPFGVDDYLSSGETVINEGEGFNFIRQETSTLAQECDITLSLILTTEGGTAADGYYLGLGKLGGEVITLSDALTLEDCAAAPSSGYIPYVAPTAGTVYCVKTEKDTYAKLEITSVVNNSTTRRVAFKWVYQHSGSRSFDIVRHEEN